MGTAPRRHPRSPGARAAGAPLLLTPRSRLPPAAANPRVGDPTARPACEGTVLSSEATKGYANAAARHSGGQGCSPQTQHAEFRRPDAYLLVCVPRALTASARGRAPRARTLELGSGQGAPGSLQSLKCLLFF